MNQMVYCLHSRQHRRVKLGRTNNIARRIRELESEHGSLELFHCWQSDVTVRTIHRLEAAIQFHYRKHHLFLEWYKEDVLATVQQLDLKAVRAAYKDSQLVEIRLPKALARLDIEAILARSLTPE